MDFNSFGLPLSDDPLGERKYLCDSIAIDLDLCKKENLGKYIINNPENKTTSIQAQYILINKENQFTAEGSYFINETGYKCVTADIINLNSKNEPNPEDLFTTFLGLIEWNNPYGKLPASEHPKLVFYGVLSLVYVVFSLVWAFLLYKYWQDLLPIQHYITGVLIFLIAEMSANYGYLDNFNQSGKSNYPLLVLVVILDAGRNSLCFFILLIVSLGYGVIKPTLGKTMLKCQLLTLIHFLCGCLYGAGAMLTNPDRVDSYILLFVLPLSISMTAFYVWILQGMAATILTLEQRQQPIKLKMFLRLRYTIGGSILLLLMYFIANGLFFNKSSEKSFINDQWQNRWFLTDGWLAVLFLVIFTAIMVLWRPTPNNQKYGLQELAQDESAADALDLEQRIQSEDRANNNNNNNMEDNNKIIPAHLDGGVNIFDIGADDEDDEENKQR
ncbi:hypothetical protein K502DRAFT_309621 [Neoconidiobolus thromboides FSU 785]|nr:hypothetical protein K502DRAFT_309621 [Neoconidiobolus thromboides FSU 785]